MLAVSAYAGLALGLVASSDAIMGGALVLAALAIWLMIARLRVGRGNEGRNVVMASVAQYVLMLALLPIIPELAVIIVPATIIPVFVASPYLQPKALTRYSIAVWCFSAIYALLAFSILHDQLDRQVLGLGAVSPEEAVSAAWGVLANYAGRMDLAFGVQSLGVLVVVAIILRLLHRYSMANQDVHHLALHDNLTGLANRALFMNRLEHALERGQRRHRGTGVVFIDVDEFKVINDRHGHGYGDDVLRQVAQRIDDDVRASDTPARVGGDEFAILLEDLAGAAEADVVAQRLRDRLAEPLQLPDGDHPVRVSIGIAFDEDSCSAPEALLQDADDAMYESKRQGQGDLVAYHPGLTSASAERRALKRAFRGVVERDELRLQFQPIIELGGGSHAGVQAGGWRGSVAGVEALVRWEDPERGRQMPARFVSLAEETGDIVPIGRWVLQEAVRQVVAWQASTNHPHLFVAVNVSGGEIGSVAFADDVAAVIAASGASPADLVLEVNERLFDSDIAAYAGVFEQLHALGVRLAIDDFGTGHAALGDLKGFPADLLKLDRSLVADAAKGARDAAVARTAVYLGEALGAQVVAEGIESHEERQTVTELGFHLGQGYLFSRPLDPEAMGALLGDSATAPGTTPAAEPAPSGALPSTSPAA